MRLQQLARDLWPYLQPLVQATSRTGGSSGGGGGGGGGGGAPSPHALSSSHHTGTLADNQAPQFLKTDGSRTLVGNLPVAAGITIDGVDLSAHAADPNAHHAAATAGHGIELIVQNINVKVGEIIDPNYGLMEHVGTKKIRAKLGASGGLGFDVTGAIIAKAGDGIDINANIMVDVTDIIDTMYGLTEANNDIRIKRDTNSGLIFGASGGLAMGTPSSISATSSNHVTSTTHGHAVVSSSDVSAGPGVNTLLHATPAGGLILATLTVKGNVDIINGGDLTVGNNVLFVDVSQESVGILRAPDPQFALDVNGPIRGTELVGKHAIQLEDLALLLHFDGGHPYESNYTGEPNAIPNGQVPTSNANVHYRPGKFYKAVVLGRARTNLCTNPSFEASLSGWSIFNAAGGNLVSVRDTSEFFFGEASARLDWTTVNNSQFYHQPVSSAVAGSYTFSCWMRASVPTTVQMMISNGSTFAIYALATKDVTEDWQMFTITTTVTPVAGDPLRITILPQGVANRLWVDGVCLEQTSKGSFYYDGSMGDGFAWTGTAHLSTSTRGTSALNYSLSNMVAHRWTVMGWFCWPFEVPPNNNGMFRLGFGGSPGYFFECFAHSTGIYTAKEDVLGSGSIPHYAGSFVPGQWYHVAFSYTPGAMRYYINGQLLSTRNVNFGSYWPTSIALGTMTGGQRGDVMIDDLVVSRRALSSDRIKAIYESDAPVFAESSVFHFRATPKGLVWADEEGLWMRDTDGDTVLGAYGGAAATKSWGGFTLAQGDIVFGRFGASDGGWLRFDRDGVSSKPYLSLGYSDKTVFALDSGGATLDGVLDISTNGGIYQGTGSFATPTTGLKIWNQSGIGRIGGFNGGTAQWYANTDGKLYAGGGAVMLDASGISIAGDSDDYGNYLNFDRVRALTFMDGTSAYGFVGGSKFASTYQVGVASLSPTPGGPAELILMADAQGTVWGPSSPPRIELRANTGGTNSLVVVDGQTINIGHSTGTPSTIHLDGTVIINDTLRPVHIWQSSATGALPVLSLEQSDLSEEFIQFVGTVAAGNPIQTAALGTYYGKIRVSVNGTFKYIPLYNS